MTAVIDSRASGPASATVPVVEESPLVEAEERKVRAARRFGTVGTVLTMLWLFAAPAFVFTVEGWHPEWQWPMLVLYPIALGLHVWRIRQHLAALGSPAPLWFVLVACPVALVITLYGLMSGLSGAMWSLVAGVLLGDVVTGRRARSVAVWVFCAAVLVFGLGLPISLSLPYGADWLAWFVTIMATFYVATMWTIDAERLWWLKMVTDMNDARRAAGELATARERLRLSDDLHDILGHALEVVAFKSELAARLLSVDGERARAEMEEVQRVARESLIEVRAMVRETRQTDLVTELAGARAVLQSAGIALVVDGDPTTLGPTARNVLGRVLREAMTNVLRHAQPSRCTIEIRVVDGDARLRVVNDGTLPSDVGDEGTGLAALSRYLDEHAGRLDAGPAEDGTFRLDAVLPGAAR
jgi:two-component system, NarL family, sensor histidine kinase DesK